MFCALEKAIEATIVSKRLGELLIEQIEEEKWKQQLKSYLEHEQIHYELWQYTYCLAIGRYYERRVADENIGESVDEIIKIALLNEMNKAILYYELWTTLSGAQNKVAERALRRSLEHAYLFFTMMSQIRLTDQILQ